MITITIIGTGNRAKVYTNILDKYFPGLYNVVAVFGHKEGNEYFKQKYSIPDNMIFNDWKYFLKQPKLSDMVFITTPDTMHFLPCIHAIKKGYAILLEKPIAMSLKETRELAKMIDLYPNSLIAVGYVLRHSPHFVTIKNVLNSGRLGKIIDIQHNENIGYYFYAHNFVRGLWRSTKDSAPLIISKSCHDLDILLYLSGEQCKKVSSFGELTYFTNKNFDKETMTERCIDCSRKHSCPYSALEIYKKDRPGVATFTSEHNLETSPYGRCVFACDNNVVDHQVTILEFENGVHATFNVSAFTNEFHRSTKIMCERGEIRASELSDTIEVIEFGKEPEYINTNKLFGGHGGADEMFTKAFMEAYINKTDFEPNLRTSIESHIIGYLAEESRLNGGVVIDL